jgi:hypothetical protein
VLGGRANEHPIEHAVPVRPDDDQAGVLLSGDTENLARGWPVSTRSST